MIVSASANLFTGPAPVVSKPDRGYPLRDYQAEDAGLIVQQWDGGSVGVLCRHATGMGKSVLLADVARTMNKRGRVLILVDVGSLAKDLRKSVAFHTGEQPGVFTGELRANWHSRQIVVATVQSMYAKTNGRPNYESFDPDEFSAVLVDECESALADRFSETVLHFIDGNENCKLLGVTATPFRSDKTAMSSMFDHERCSRGGRGPLNRDIFYGYLEGWLVKPTQAFVSCELDFSTLKLRKNKNGEKDYSENDVASLLLEQDEEQWLEMANAIHGVAKGRPSIIICPNDTRVAEVVAAYLCGAADDDDAAHAVHGKMGERAHDMIDRFKAGGFPYISSVNMLYKGFDADRVEYVFLLRKTKSRRIYEQSLGRGTRPLRAIRELLASAKDAEERKRIIAESDKPKMTMVDLVGVDSNVSDISVLDIIGDHLPVNLRERAKNNMLDQLDDDELSETFDVGEEARSARDQLRAEAEARRIEEERERKRRSLVQVQGRVSVQESGDFSRSAGSGGGSNLPGFRRGTSSAKQVKLLIALGIMPDTALGYGKRQAGAIISQKKKASVRPDWRAVNNWERNGGKA